MSARAILTASEVVIPLRFEVVTTWQHGLPGYHDVYRHPAGEQLFDKAIELRVIGYVDSSDRRLAHEVVEQVVLMAEVNRHG